MFSSKSAPSLSAVPFVGVIVKLIAGKRVLSWSDMSVPSYAYSLNTISVGSEIAAGFGSAVAFRKSQLLQNSFGLSAYVVALFPNQLSLMLYTVVL